VTAAAHELLDGVRCRIAARDRQMTMDEPTGLGGTVAGPDPVERELQVGAAA